MPQEITVLIVSPYKDDFDQIPNGAAIFDGETTLVWLRDTVEAWEYLSENDVEIAGVQVYLDTRYDRVAAEKFLKRIDSSFGHDSKNSVVLVDDSSSISALISLAMARCVFDVLNLPILRDEVESTLEKRFSRHTSLGV